MLWTNDMDRALLATESSNEGAPASKLASILTEKLGWPFSEDQIRNRLRRIKAQIESGEKARVVSQDEQNFSLDEVPKDRYVGPRVAFFDIETTGLKAHVGRMLWGSIADSWGNVKNFSLKDYPGKTLIDDSVLVDTYARELEKYDGEWVSWNGKLFDCPFMNARLLKGGKPILRGDRVHVDLMYYSKGSSARVGTSRLAGVSEFFNTGNSKTPLDFDTWNLAMAGDLTALDKVGEHCEADVLVLRDVYEHLKPLIRNKHR
jgi:uncharacterized protein YprB with RNaseH-like and TPR domain